MLPNRLMKPFVSAMAIATCAVTGHALVASAQGLPGLTFRWNNREGFRELGYVIDISNEPNDWGRYRLKIGSRDLELAASQFTINIPNHFDGNFDSKKDGTLKNVEVRVCSRPGSFLRRAKCDSVDVDEASIDEDGRQITIYPSAPVPAGSNVELVFHEVRNPRNPGFYQFNGLIESPGDVPLLRPIGSWIVVIDRDSTN